jgi:DNA-binding response OmpR family regulator
MSRAHLLYVEDDESLGFVTRDQLELAGYTVTHLTGGAAVRRCVADGINFDLCLLDVMLPEVDGFELARQIRERDRDVPILFLTAKSLKEDRLHGLRLGADDYLTKPFGMEELMLKIEVFLRRNRVRPATPSFDSGLIGQYRFLPDQLQLIHQKSGESKRLTQREAELLQLLSENRERVLERGTILKKIWGQDDYFLGRSLDVFVSRLRKYLRGDERIKIENIHGVGFSLTITGT